MRLLIGYDGSEYSDVIFNDLKRAGLPSDTHVHVVSVGDLLMSNPGVQDTTAEFPANRVTAALKQAQIHAEHVIREAEGLVAKASEQIKLTFPTWKVSGEVVTGTPTWELIDAARKWNADLVVVGSQGRSAIGRFFLGSVSKRIVTDAHCSVRVSRVSEKKDENLPPRIIVGVDGSPAAEQAIYAIGQRVWQEGTEIRLLSVDDGTSPSRIASRLPQAAEMINSYSQMRESRISSMLEWATKELNAIGLKTAVFISEGDPKNVILEQAREWNAACIFVGTRDFKSSFERFRLGSVSTAVVTNAHCSVEVVRASEKSEDKN